MATIDDLKAELDRARVGVARLEAAQHDDRRRLVEEFEDRLKTELGGKYGKLMAELRARERAAEDAYHAAVVAEAAARDLPRGVLYEWVRKESRRYANDYALRPTGRRGVLEIVTPQTVFPANTGYWRRPEPGAVIVRLVKKDGVRGLQWERWTEKPESYQTHWLPAGVAPEGAAPGAVANASEAA